MQSTGNWKAAASVFVVLCLVGTQLEVKLWAEDAGHSLKIVVANGDKHESSGIMEPNNQSGPTVLLAATQGGATSQASVKKSNPTVDKGKPFWKKKWFLIGAGAAAAAVVIVLVSNRKPQADVTVGAPTVGAPQ